MILITGGTGFLGRELAARLLRLYPDVTLCLLVRDSQNEAAEFRAQHALEDIFGREEAREYQKRMKVIRGDVTEPCFGLGQSSFEKLAGEISSVYHCAATTELNNDLEAARRINVGGTQRVLEFSRQSVKTFGSEFRLFHISTAYVAGSKRGIVHSTDLDPSGPFRNAYERSKAEAEMLVREQREEVPSCIFRPSIIVGDSVTGQTSAFNVIYVPAKLLVRGLFSCFPALPHAPFDIVPVDYTADAIVYLSSLQPPNGSCYHITAGVGRETNPWEILEQLFSAVNKYSRRGRNLLHIPPLVSPELLSLALSSLEAARSSMKTLERIVCDRINIFRQTLPFVPYMVGNPQFDNTDTLLDTRKTLPAPPLFLSYAERLFKYCVDTNWGKLPWTNPSNFELWRHRNSPFPHISY
jgi:thioester reductase-like protein